MRAKRLRWVRARVDDRLHAAVAERAGAEDVSVVVRRALRLYLAAAALMEEKDP